LRNPVLFGGYKNEEEKRKAAETPTFDAVSHRKRFLIAPISIIAVALILIIIPQYGLEVAIEFKGGTILNYTYEGDIDTSAVQSKVEELAADKVNIKTGTAIGSTELKTMTIEFASKSGLTVEVQHSISQALETDFEASNLQTSGSQDVSPTMGKAFFLKCFVAVLFSFILMLVYIALRFKNLGGLSAGAFTIFALLINVIIVFAVFVFMRFPIDANFMAVILTILCYTINDTIVVFDRIRENRTLHGKRMSFDGLVNHSVKQSFRRSLNTTITTCIAMLTISIVAIIAGVSSMLTFAFPLLIGLIMGFMTSLYTVGPFWASWKLRKPKAKA
jgi:preprotein translocase SecF subunit